MKYFLDTCIFNWVLDGKCSISDLPDGEYFITHIQQDELSATKNEARRNELRQIFETFKYTQTPTGVFVLGKSNLGEAALIDDGIYDQIFSNLSKRQPQLRKLESHRCDAITGATVYSSGYGLVTADEVFSNVMNEFVESERIVLWK